MLPTLKKLSKFLFVCCVFALSGCYLDASSDTSVLDLSESFEENQEAIGDIEESYEDETILVHCKAGHLEEGDLSGLKYRQYRELSKAGPGWYHIELQKGVSATKALAVLGQKRAFDMVEPNYIYENTVDSLVDGNPYADHQTYLNLHRVPETWHQLAAGGQTAGGSSDVIVAVIDSGVDYNHPDLRDAIWKNLGEIPGNGIDDDGNGYVDDVNGYDFYGNDCDPMDDNGHGTHVAGIIGARNNGAGTVGIAYNSKIMALKASDHNGHLSAEHIAEAVRYAYMNGASVINMSFGGPSLSSLVAQALSDAYHQCVLIAAAGNSGRCNQPGCPTHNDAQGHFPASLSYVVGVMSCDPTGSYRSQFSNFDHYYYQGNEYNVYACGENVISTFPNNRYAVMSGTSMAAPMVAGAAALLRSKYTDRDMYPTLFIHGQLCGTGQERSSGEYPVLDIYDALQGSPSPDVRFNDFHIFDSARISALNNGDGMADVGEKIHIGVDSWNILGKARNVQITLIPDTSNGHADDPLIVLENDTIQVPDIGPFSLGTGGYVYENDEIVDYERSFVATINPNARHGEKQQFTVRYSFQNGLDDTDTTVYEAEFYNAFSVLINHGISITGSIQADLTLESNMLYLLNDVTVESNATLTVEAGARIEFNGERQVLTSYGTVNMNGTEDNPVIVSASGHFCLYGSTDLSYVRAEEANFVGCNTNEENGRMHTIDHCYFNMFSCTYTNVTNCFINTLFTFSPVEDATTVLSRNKIGTATIKVEYDNWPLIVDSNLISSVEFRQTLATIRDSADIQITNNVFRNYSHDHTLGERFVGSGDGNLFLGEHHYYRDSHGDLMFDIYKNEGQGDYSAVWPFITRFALINRQGEETKRVEAGPVTFRVEFNTAMDPEGDFSLYFGSTVPFTDSHVTGMFVSDTVWEGEFTVKSVITGGVQKTAFRGVESASAQDPWITFRNCTHHTIYNEFQTWSFEVDVTSAMSMSLSAMATEEGILLTWLQDDYETLMGYNVYRADEKDGNYVRLNNVVIPAEENVYLDVDALPGQTYWYTFTVVLSDLSESAPAGKVSCTAIDNTAPTVYHTPVNTAYVGNNLTISCTASDNVAVAQATLYYRYADETEWRSLAMSKASNRFSATIYGSELVEGGIYYYIAVSDGHNTTLKGDSENPYYVVVKDASLLNNLGDVDGDGVITTKDALMIIRCINGELLLTDDQFARADLNKDGVLSSFEALRILQYINGKVTSLEM